MYFSSAADTFYAVDCDNGNNYGVASVAYGLAANPCRNCKLQEAWVAQHMMSRDVCVQTAACWDVKRQDYVCCIHHTALAHSLCVQARQA